MKLKQKNATKKQMPKTILSFIKLNCHRFIDFKFGFKEHLACTELYHAAIIH